jgi:hypothetical protein
MMELEISTRSKPTIATSRINTDALTEGSSRTLSLAAKL